MSGGGGGERPDQLDIVAAFAWPFSIAQCLIFLDVRLIADVDILPDWLGLLITAHAGWQFRGGSIQPQSVRAGSLHMWSALCWFAVIVLQGVGLSGSLTMLAWCFVVPGYLIGVCWMLVRIARTCGDAGFLVLKENWDKLARIVKAMTAILIALYVYVLAAVISGSDATHTFSVHGEAAWLIVVPVAAVPLVGLWLGYKTRAARRGLS